jgi:hypothetical protein
LRIILDHKGDKIVEKILNTKVKEKRISGKQARKCEQHIRNDNAEGGMNKKRK